MEAAYEVITLYAMLMSWQDHQFFWRNKTKQYSFLIKKQQDCANVELRSQGVRK